MILTLSDFDAMFEDDSDSNSSDQKKPSPKKLNFPTIVNTKATKTPQPDTNDCTNNVCKQPTESHSASEIIVKSYTRRKPKIKQCKVSSKSKTPIHRNKNSVDLPTLQLIRSLEKECFDQAKKKTRRILVLKSLRLLRNGRSYSKIVASTVKLRNVNYKKDFCLIILSRLLSV